jgi:hypothetical protein
MDGDEREACGRCAMSSVVDTAMEGTDETERATRDPFAGDRIEVDEDDLRKVSPSAWLAGVKRRIDDVATRLTYGR